MGETTVGHVAGEVVRALYGAGYMESTIGQYRKSIRALERYAGGPDAVYTRGLGAGFAASTFSERTGGFSRQRWFDYGRLARLCDSYLRSGSVDLGKWRRSCLCSISCCGFSHDDFSGLGRACRPRNGLNWMVLVSPPERTGKDYDQHAPSTVYPSFAAERGIRRVDRAENTCQRADGA